MEVFYVLYIKKNHSFIHSHQRPYLQKQDTESANVRLRLSGHAPLPGKPPDAHNVLREGSGQAKVHVKPEVVGEQVLNALHVLTEAGWEDGCKCQAVVGKRQVVDDVVDVAEHGQLCRLEQGVQAGLGGGAAVVPVLVPVVTQQRAESPK